jgi:hypothetical protein
MGQCIADAIDDAINLAAGLGFVIIGEASVSGNDAGPLDSVLQSLAGKLEDIKRDFAWLMARVR